MIDPPTREDGQLALRHVDAGNLERMQREAATDVDERVAQPVLNQVPSHLSIEDLLVEADQAIQVGSDRREVMGPRDQRHASQPTGEAMVRQYVGASGSVSAVFIEAHATARRAGRLRPLLELSSTRPRGPLSALGRRK